MISLAFQLLWSLILLYINASYKVLYLCSVLHYFLFFTGGILLCKCRFLLEKYNPLVKRSSESTLKLCQTEVHWLMAIFSKSCHFFVDRGIIFSENSVEFVKYLHVMKPFLKMTHIQHVSSMRLVPVRGSLAHVANVCHFLGVGSRQRVGR